MMSDSNIRDNCVSDPWDVGVTALNDLGHPCWGIAHTNVGGMNNLDFDSY